MCALHPGPPRTSLPTPFPLGFHGALALGALLHASSAGHLALVIYFTYSNVYVSMLFSQIIPPSPPPPESKSLFFMYVSP